MRFRTMMLALALLASTASRGEAWEKGVRMGLDLSTFRGPFGDLIGLKSKLGVTGGGFTAFPVNRIVAIQPEAMFVMKGAKTEIEVVDFAGNPTGRESIFWDLRYLEVPVLVRITPMPNASLQPRLFLGPSLGFSLGGRFKSDFGSDDIQGMRAVDGGVTGGIGVRGAVARRGVIADLRYTTGFRDLFDVQGNSDAINSVFALTFGVEL